MPFRSRTRFMLFSLVLSVVVLGVKFWAYYRTGSAAIFSDAVESVVNVAAAAFGLFAVRFSAQAPDEEHPYGHGKMEFVAAGFEGGLILMAGAGMFYQAYRAFVHGSSQLAQLDFGLYLVAGTLLANLLAGLFLIRQGRRINSPTVVADGRHLAVDSYSSAGLLAGLVLMYFTGWYWLDWLLAATLGLWVVYHGVDLVRESIGGLLDQTDTQLIARIAALLARHRHDAWIDVHNLRVVRHGADIHIDCHITLPYYWTLAQVHEQLKHVEHLLQAELAGGARLEIFVHADPCIFEACPSCRVPACPVRQHAFVQQLSWTPERLVLNQKHALQPTTSAPV